MISTLPIWIIAVFVTATLLTTGVLQYSAKRAAFGSRTTNAVNFGLAFLLIFQGTLAATGFYRNSTSPALAIVFIGVLPSLILTILLLLLSGDFVERLDLRMLTLIHLVRIPVEIALYGLYLNGAIPQLMTFEGRNPDILVGFTAPVIAWVAFRGGVQRKWLLISWNVFGLVFLLNIVVNAALSIPGPIQQFAFDQPNVAVLHFPFTWLPTVIVPIVLFCHLASLKKLLMS
jgi:hypothetical protein